MITEGAEGESPQSERFDSVVHKEDTGSALEAVREAELFQQQLQRIFSQQQQQHHQHEQTTPVGNATSALTTASSPEAAAPSSRHQRPASTGNVWKMLPGKLGSFRARSQRKPLAASDHGKARQDAIESKLAKLALEEESGTLCTVLDGQLLGTVEDSDFIRLRWWRLDADGARNTKLTSLSAGFYQPSALDIGSVVQVEAWPRFARDKRFYAQFGPLHASDHVEREIATKFNGDRAAWAAHVNDGPCLEEAIVLDLAQAPGGQIQRISVLGEHDSGPVFSYEPSEAAHLLVVLDDVHPRKLRLSKKSSPEGAPHVVDLTLGGTPDARKVLVLGLLRHLAPGIDVDILLASDLEDALDASTSDEESDATVDGDLADAAGVGSSASGGAPVAPGTNAERGEAEAQGGPTHPSASPRELAAHISRLDRESAYKDALIRDLREQIEELKSTAQRESMRSVAETGKSLAQVSDLAKEADKLRKELGDAQETIDSLRARDLTAQAEIASYQERLDETACAADAARAQAAEQTRRTAALERQIEESRQREDNLTQRVRELETAAQHTEQQVFDLQASLQAQINLRVESEAQARGLQERVEVAAARRKALKAKFDSLAKDVGRIVQLAGLESLMDMEDFIRESDVLRQRLRSREAEKQDLLSENASLRAAMDHTASQAAGAADASSTSDRRGGQEMSVTRAASEPGKVSSGGSLFGRRVSNVARAAKEGVAKSIGPAMGSSDALDLSQPSEIDLGKISLNRADRRQLALVYQLANSLTEQLTEKEDHLEQQRFANRKLAERVRELEIEATRWRR